MSNIIQIPLSRGKVAFIDSIDFDKVSKYKWYARAGKNGIFYATSTLHKNIHMHRLILDVTNRFDFVDHINHDGLNNCRSNLRVVNNKENMYNSKSRKNTSSKFKGVHWNKEKQRWTSQITADKKTIHVGHFKSEIEAAIAYNEKAKILHGQFAFLNELP